jgi:hypothetical protein
MSEEVEQPTPTVRLDTGEEEDAERARQALQLRILFVNFFGTLPEDAGLTVEGGRALVNGRAISLAESKGRLLAWLIDGEEFAPFRILPRNSMQGEHLAQLRSAMGLTAA